MYKIAFALFAAIALLAGCGTNPVLIQPVPLPQLIAQFNNQFCPASKLILADLQLPGLVLPPGAAGKLPKVAKDLGVVCAAGVTLNATNVQTIIDSSLPDLLSIVELIPGPNQGTAIAAITAAQILMPLIKAQVQALPAVK